MIKDLNKEIDHLMKNAQYNKDQGNLKDACVSLEQILKIDKKNKKALNNLGNIHKDFGNYDKAIKFYLKSISIDQNYDIPKSNLAVLYHELGNLKEAEILYKNLVKKNKTNFSILFNLSTINFDHISDDITSFIKETLNKNILNNYNTASAYFILAKYKKKKKNFSNEIEYLNKGHDFFCRSINQNIFSQSLTYWLNIIPKRFNDIKFINTSIVKDKNKKINPIFIIGMPRSGSTLIESIISSGNKKIPNGGETAVVNWAFLKSMRKKYLNFITEKKEIVLDIEEVNEDIIKKYENLNLLLKEKNYFFIDKSLENFFYVDLILQLFPNAKFIHCERNYLDNIFAIYQNFLTKMTWTHSLNNILVYMDNYLKVMKYYKNKHKNKIYSINIEELTKNDVQLSKEIYNFCNLEWSEESLKFYKRKDLLSKTASNVQIREKIFKYDSSKYKVYKKYILKFKDKYTWLQI